MKLLNHVQLFATPWTVACQAPPSMGFSKQEYWNGLPSLPLGLALGSPIFPSGCEGKLGVSCYSSLVRENTIFSSVQSLSCVRLFATTWTAAHQAPPSMGFSRQEYWSVTSGFLSISDSDSRVPAELGLNCLLSMRVRARATLLLASISWWSDG